jgi:hypothetical protein
MRDGSLYSLKESNNLANIGVDLRHVARYGTSDKGSDKWWLSLALAEEDFPNAKVRYPLPIIRRYGQ